MFAFAEKVGRVSGFLKGMPEDTQTETVIEMMVAEAIKTSEIEGETLSRKDVMSSIKNNLGFNQNIARIQDKNADGAAELMIDVRDSYAEELSKEKLFSRHRMIMKGSRGKKRVTGGLMKNPCKWYPVLSVKKKFIMKPLHQPESRME